MPLYFSGGVSSLCCVWFLVAALKFRLLRAASACGFCVRLLRAASACGFVLRAASSFYAWLLRVFFHAFSTWSFYIAPSFLVLMLDIRSQRGCTYEVGHVRKGHVRDTGTRKGPPIQLAASVGWLLIHKTRPWLMAVVSKLGTPNSGEEKRALDVSPRTDTVILI